MLVSKAHYKTVVSITGGLFLALLILTIGAIWGVVALENIFVTRLYITLGILFVIGLLLAILLSEKVEETEMQKKNLIN